MLAWFVIVLGLRYIIDLVKLTKQKNNKHWFKYFLSLINWKLLLPMLVLLVYLVLPIHNTTVKLTLVMGVWLALLYLVFENRKKIDIYKLIKMFCLGLIVSGLMALLRPISVRLDQVMAYFVVYGYTKFSGFTGHPNLYAMFIMLANSALLVLKYVNKIDNLSYWG
ncbi:MAG: hypothetical protein J5598_01915, partial [Clostridia bacterium]|nr:hypothetical protein [Clostridia bacterium]